MAGARACASVTVPKRLSSASHPDSAPGTVTSSTLCCGIVACPFASSASRVMRLPARPLALSPYSLRSLADHTMAKMSPPMPVIGGSTTFSTAAPLDGALQVPRGGSVAQLLEHQRAGEHRRHRVGDAFPCERWSGAVHRLEQAPTAGVQVRAGREAEATHESRAQVGEDVAVQVVR